MTDYYFFIDVRRRSNVLDHSGLAIRVSNFNGICNDQLTIAMYRRRNDANDSLLLLLCSSSFKRNSLFRRIHFVNIYGAFTGFPNVGFLQLTLRRDDSLNTVLPFFSTVQLHSLVLFNLYLISRSSGHITF